MASAGASAGLGFAQSALSSIAASSASRQNSRNTGKAARANIQYGLNDYLVNSNIAYEQERAIDREVGDMLSQSGLKAMKAEASLRAAGASTGLSGGDINEVVAQAGYDQVLDNQIIIAKGRSQKTNTYRSRLSAYMDFEAKTNAATQATENNLISNSTVNLQMLSSALNTATSIAGNMDKKTPDKKTNPSLGTSNSINNADITGSAQRTQWNTNFGSQQSRMLQRQW